LLFSLLLLPLIRHCSSPLPLLLPHSPLTRPSAYTLGIEARLHCPLLTTLDLSLATTTRRPC
jgi:hypothetical protein